MTLLGKNLHWIGWVLIIGLSYMAASLSRDPETVARLLTQIILQFAIAGYVFWRWTVPESWRCRARPSVFAFGCAFIGMAWTLRTFFKP